MVLVHSLLFLVSGCAPRPKTQLDGIWKETAPIGCPTILVFRPPNVVKRIDHNGTDEGTYNADWTKNPPQLDLHWQSGGEIKTLIELSGEALMLQPNEAGETRPKNFKAEIYFQRVE
jgi:hypothetical protein